MTYCLGILLDDGLVLASDSRSNAGVDDITKVRKMALFERPGERVIAVLSAGNLATTQSVVTTLQQAAHGGDAAQDLFAAATLFDAAQIVGNSLRTVMARDQEFVAPYGDASGSFLVGGQIAGEAPRLFQIYSAGNFVEATPRSQILQIGEAKYGKPILDRTLHNETTLDHAAKLALLSYDATIRSNLSVDGPIDLLRYAKDSLSTEKLRKYSREDPYWVDLRAKYGEGLLALVDALPSPPD
ncbi:MAG: peptidase [Rhodospirillaceae bacterium]|nr:peptidase [Rhodospirillaceae bacterium]MDD9915012.1 peptidase [Rhodospirillaceae bacterium]